MRTIELATYIVTPIVAGQLFTFAGYVPTGFFIGGWNVVSIVFQYLLLTSIYNQYPKLDTKLVQEDNKDQDEMGSMMDKGKHLSSTDGKFTVLIKK